MNRFKTAARCVLIWLRVVSRPDLVTVNVMHHPAPEAIKPGCIYVVSEGQYKKWAYFRCPADQNEIIQLALMPNRRPRWSVTADILDRPTLYPSVRQVEGSYAHFWVKRGHVEWCEDTGESRVIQAGVSRSACDEISRSADV